MYLGYADGPSLGPPVNTISTPTKTKEHYYEYQINYYCLFRRTAMSFWDDLGNFANDVLHGNVGGAVHDVGQGIHDALGGSSGTGSGAGSTSMIPGLQAEQALQALANARAAAAKATTAARGVQGGTPGAPCCNRYNLNSGFLVDGVTGSVWQFDAN